MKNKISIKLNFVRSDAMSAIQDVAGDDIVEMISEVEFVVTTDREAEDIGPLFFGITGVVSVTNVPAEGIG